MRLAVDDVSKAIERRPKDKMYRKYKDYLVEVVIHNKVVKEVTFIKKLVEKAVQQVSFKKRVKMAR